MSEYNTQPVKTVSEGLKRKRKKKRKSAFKKWFSRFLLLSLLIGIIFGLYKLDQSTLFRVSAITVSNNHVMSDHEIIDALDIEINDRLWLIYDWFNKDKLHAFASIEDFSFKKQDNVLMISVSEVAVVGFDQEQLWLENGAHTPITSFNEHYLQKVPMISGFNEEELSKRLGESLALLQTEILMIISNVHQVETSYDQAQLWLLLHDQKQVFSDFRSLELLNNYPLFVDQIAPENDCIYLDYASRSARSSPCE